MPSATALAVELDRQYTYADYLNLPDDGVQEYWMASEEEKTVEVWRRQGGKLEFHAIFTHSQTLTTPLLPGLEISLEKIFPQS